MIMIILAWVLIVYGAILLFAGFVKSPTMIKLVKIKFGKKLSDETATKVMYISGVLLAIAGVVLLVIL